MTTAVIVALVALLLFSLEWFRASESRKNAPTEDRAARPPFDFRRPRDLLTVGVIALVSVVGMLFFVGARLVW